MRINDEQDLREIILKQYQRIKQLEKDLNNANYKWRDYYRHEQYKKPKTKSKDKQTEVKSL